MKNKKHLLLLFAAVSLTLFSCKKNNIADNGALPDTKNPSASYEKRVSFGKVLAKAIDAEPLLREKIKNESLKQFDLDYDVLFQTIKDDILPDNESVINKISKYASSKGDFEKLVNSLPLLTIYVPELANFSAESWKTTNEIPVVALKPERKQSDVEYYNSNGEKGIIKYGMIPSSATLVVKDNERIVVDNVATNSTIKTSSLNTLLAKGSDLKSSYLTKNGFSYSFTSAAFDNTKGKVASKLKTNYVINQNSTDPVDPINVSAYKSGAEWQRDYIYYGIDPSAGITTGKFRNNYSEYIRSFSFLHGYDFDNLHIGDDAADQSPTKNGGLPGSIVEWTGGALEMRISVLLNAKSGGGQELRKIFSVKASDLFNISYVRASSGGRPPFAMKYDGLIPKAYFPNIELVPFDLDNYGTIWKFIITEFDPSQEITNTITNTTVIANNFEITATGVSKIGAKFGSSITTTQSSVFQTKTTVGSDDLGEGILDFRYPVITNIQMGPLYAPGDSRPIRGTEGENYTTYEVTSGVISMSIEPKKIY
jgi:hypothetical protein